MEVSSNNNHISNGEKQNIGDILVSEQITSEAPTDKTTVDIHTDAAMENNIKPNAATENNTTDDAILKPTEFLPGISNQLSNNDNGTKQLVKSANMPAKPGVTCDFDYIDGEISNNSSPSPQQSNSQPDKMTKTQPELTAAGGGTSKAPPSLFSSPQDSPDCAVVPGDSSIPRDTHAREKRYSDIRDKRYSEPSPPTRQNTSKRKSIRRSLSKIFSRARGKNNNRKEEVEEKETGSTAAAGRIPTPAQTPKPVRFDRLQDAFIHYNHDNKIHGRPHGRGICVIFSLFTGELTGYNEDRRNAFNFFHKLGYDVFCDDTYFTNCTRAQMLSSCDKIRSVIAKKASEHGGKPYYDRFVLMVLTHGEKGGLMTCADPHGFLEEVCQVQGKGGGYYSQRVLTKVEEICDKFKHDQVPALKDKPKLFLIQACRGSDVLRHAGSSQVPLKEQQYDLSNLNIRPEVPIDADQIVFYATTPEHESWVAKSGSWFIEKTLEIFKRHHKDRHVEEMMTVVNLVISNERGQTLLKSGEVSEVVQMPCKFSTLRMAFYL